ncbi:MAG TPA: DUF4091 domain-containing protein [Armatimonadetes bacterium]|jgi:hypothetical protein|nr:DUF4091 domain-containing protein [Armatimonadota bacterium]
MRALVFAVLACIAPSLTSPCSGAAAARQPLPLKPFTYVEDFEQPCQMVVWATNGKQEVHFSGVTEEKAFSGKRSYKLDVTIREGAYHYFGIRLPRVPCAGELRLSGRLWVEALPKGARAGLGYNIILPPSQHSGCSTVGTINSPTPEWKALSGDLVAAGKQTASNVIGRYTAGMDGSEVAPFLELWSVPIWAAPGQRITLYVDDVRIEGRVPDGDAYAAAAGERFMAARARTARRIADWRARLDEATVALRDVPPQDGLGARILESARAGVKSVAETLATIEKRGYINASEVDPIEASLSMAAHAGPTLRELGRSKEQGLPYLSYVPRAISNTRISPREPIVPARMAREIEMAACPGEYESATFVLQALAQVRGLTLETTDLQGARGRIPRDAVDLSIVKCWYQAGTEIGFTQQRLLAPELLLKDDALVRVDHEKKENFIRSTDAAGKGTYLPCSGPTSEHLANVRPKDAETLQPVEIETGTARQFWITLKVPEGTPAGEYEGAIRIRAQGAPASEMRLKLRVYPFRLEPCPLQHSIYYRGVLRPDGEGSISSEAKSEAQYEAEMRDLLAHGVLYPTIYQSYDDTLLRRALEIRKKAGLPAGPLYVLGIGTGSATDPKALAAHRARLQRYMAVAREFGYTDIYFYGTDEAKGEQLTVQRAAWKSVQETGAKTFVACYLGTFEAMGDLLNLAVLAGRPVPEEAEKFHGVGSRVFCYAYPQVGNEEPETYRRNFGLVLWKAGYDGAMDYAYQHAFGHVWNDFDHRTYRDHCFTYPTVDGVIGTIQWEGYREAVDDMRYIATLQKAIERARNAKTTAGVAADAARWLDGIDPQGDLDAIRQQAAEWIMRLSPQP